jgi:hypothetical protein
LQLAEITPETVARWIADLGRRGYQPSTIRILKGQLPGILTTAVTWRYLAVHPCVGVKAPREKPPRIRAFERGDVELVYLSVCRSVSDVGARHADGGRFVVEDTTKGGRDRPGRRAYVPRTAIQPRRPACPRIRWRRL